VQFDAKALTVEFQTASLFASAAHNLHFVAVRRFNLCGRRGAQTSDQISRHAILSTRRSTVQRGDLLVALLARWRLLLLLLLLLLMVLLLLLQVGGIGGTIVLVNRRFAHFVAVDGGGACG
jgi:hypothetical protein